MLTLNTVNSDGTINTDPTVTVTLRHPETDVPLEGVTVTVKEIPPREWDRLMRKHRRPMKDGLTRQMVQQDDALAATDEALSTRIVAWTGIHGADGKPLPVLPVVITDGLKLWMKKQILSAALGGLVDVSDEEVRDASFRESA